MLGNLSSDFEPTDTHGVLERLGVNVASSSEGLGWTSAFASNQRERPFESRFHAVSDCLMVLHRGGPVDMVYRHDCREYVRHIPKGGIFFLPAGHECDVALRGALDTTHIYLRSQLFHAISPTANLAPLFGDRDPVIELLAQAIGRIVDESVPATGLTVDPIASALAHRLVDLNARKPARPSARVYALSTRQIALAREFVEAHLDGDITLEVMARTCGASAEHFLRMFKVSLGLSPYQYVISRRVERAKQLLLDDRSSLADIALSCGFSHQEHLSRMFRRVTGSTPGRYRRAAR